MHSGEVDALRTKSSRVDSSIETPHFALGGIATNPYVPNTIVDVENKPSCFPDG
jgi:hypothetical protein